MTRMRRMTAAQKEIRGHPPHPRHPRSDFGDRFELPAARRLTLAAYIGGPFPEAFVQPVAVGQALAEMPLFLTPDVYVPVPLEATYQAAWADVPSFWQDVLIAEPQPPNR